MFACGIILLACITVPPLVKRGKKTSSHKDQGENLAQAMQVPALRDTAGQDGAGATQAAALQGDERSDSAQERDAQTTAPGGLEDAQKSALAAGQEPEQVDGAAVPAPPPATAGHEPRPLAANVEKLSAEHLETPSFDYEAFRESLLFSTNSMATLKETVAKIQKRKKGGERLAVVEEFLVQQFEGGALLETEDKEDLPDARVIIPRHSGLFYVRTNSDELSYDAFLRILHVEAVLNALRVAYDYYQDLNVVAVEDIYRVWQRATATICAQAPDIDNADWSYLAMPWQVPYGPAESGEWAVRQAISEAIESVQLPYRLEADFRCNVLEGDVAIEFRVTPSDVFPQYVFASDVGIVPTTAEMQRREASRYAARVGILLANYAFRSSPKIRRVWIAGIQETPQTHSCFFSACIGRRAFCAVRMSSVGDPLATLRSLGAAMEEENGVLLPTKQCFYLEDELFCPPKRHDLWTLSERSLPASAAQSLGTSRVSGLVIHEELPRTIAADDILRSIADPHAPSATEKTVRSIMGAARKTSDISVWSAAERVSGKLVDGVLDLADTESLRKELVGGDPLTKSVEQAQKLLTSQEPHEALELLLSTVNAIDKEGRYRDTDAVCYRCFDSFSERVLYNRLNTQDSRTVVLVPDAYLMAHLVISAIYASLPAEAGGNPGQALAHARRALQVAPLNTPANLGAVACMEAAGNLSGALELLRSYLQTAYQPQGLGLAYYRLGSIEWELGNREASQACYMRSISLFPPLMPFVAAELHSLVEKDSSVDLRSMDQEEIERILKDESIPVAPTARTSFIIYDGATASVDAEVFPVARELMHVLEIFAGDDVLRGIRNSLEHEPDA